MSEFYETTGMCTDECTSGCKHLDADTDNSKMQEPVPFEKQPSHAGVHDSPFLIETDIRTDVDEKLKTGELPVIDVTGLPESVKLYNTYNDLPLKNRYINQVKHLQTLHITSK